MGDCDETLRELERYLDDELSEPVHHAIQSHLDGCLDCLHAFDFQAELKQLIAEKCSGDDMPAGLLERIEQCFGGDVVPGGDAGTDVRAGQ